MPTTNCLDAIIERVDSKILSVCVTNILDGNILPMRVRIISFCIKDYYFWYVYRILISLWLSVCVYLLGGVREVVW